MKIRAFFAGLQTTQYNTTAGLRHNMRHGPACHQWAGAVGVLRGEVSSWIRRGGQVNPDLCNGPQHISKLLAEGRLRGVQAGLGGLWPPQFGQTRGTKQGHGCGGGGFRPTCPTPET